MAYEPKGVKFFDKATDREMLLVADDSPNWSGWLCYRHPDGQWVSLRKATKDDHDRVASAQFSAHGTGLTAGQFSEFMKNYVIGIMGEINKYPRR